MGSHYGKCSISFWVKRSTLTQLYEQLLESNRCTLPKNTYSIEYGKLSDVDEIFVQGYPGNNIISMNDIRTTIDQDLLISNDARRVIVSMYKARNEHGRFTEKLFNRLRQQASSCFPIQRFLDLFEYESGINTFIAGSFPLQIFLNEEWANSDLDVFTNGDKVDTFLTHSLGPGRLLGASDKRLLKPQNEILEVVKPCAYAGIFDTVTEYVMPSGFRIQVIKTGAADSINKILDSFDFDFCKIAWSLDSLIIKKRYSIENRSCIYDVNRVVNYKCAERLAKYEARGFKVLNREEMLKLRETTFKD